MRTAILISSCDYFEDCWEPMIFSIKKFWPNCSFPIYIISNFKEIKDEKVAFLKVGEDRQFASNLKRALHMIDYESIIYFQEDYFIDSFVDNASIMAHIDHCHNEGLDFIKIGFDSMFRDALRIKDSIYCQNPINKKYSINTAISIWRRHTLEMLCIDGFSGWDFERKIIPFIRQNNITIRSEVLYSKVFPEQGIKCVDGTAVRRGKWTKSGREFLESNGFNRIIEGRKTESNLLLFLMSLYRPHSLLRIPVAITIKIFQKLNL